MRFASKSRQAPTQKLVRPRIDKLTNDSTDSMAFLVGAYEFFFCGCQSTILIRACCRPGCLCYTCVLVGYHRSSDINATEHIILSVPIIISRAERRGRTHAFNSLRSYAFSIRLPNVAWDEGRQLNTLNSPLGIWLNIWRWWIYLTEIRMPLRRFVRACLHLAYDIYAPISAYNTR